MSFFKKLFGPKNDGPRFKILAHEAFGGAIRIIETPTSPGWTYSEDSRQGDGFTVMVLKYGLPGGECPLVLLAKIYTVDRDREPPADPSSTDWRGEFAPLFQSVEAINTTSSTQMTMSSTIPAAEATVDGQSSAGPWKLRIRERRSVVENEQFIVGAVGPDSLWTAHAAEIEAWFNTAAFVPIAGPC